MASGYAIRRNTYFDSVFLMGVNQRLAGTKGVRQTAALMASDQNKVLLAELGISGADILAAGPSDLVVAVAADSEAVVEAVLAGLDEALRTVQAATPASGLLTLEDGLMAKPDATMAVLTIPGGYVFPEARKALAAGLDLFIFSSNVPVEDELRLKQLARERGLLVMGPDCGTSLLNGVGLGFANAVRKGSVGAIGPSGTGLQEFTCLIHHAGLGISHAIGTGSHDLSDAIGGITTLAALTRLEADPRTEVIALVAKPAGPRTRDMLAERLEQCPKPVVACILGSTAPGMAGNVAWTETIDAAVDATARLSRSDSQRGATASASPAGRERARLRASWAPGQKYVRGVFAGGTLCYQTQQILREAGLAIRSNTPLDPQDKLDPREPSRGHVLMDMGDDVFTLGRLHPMIDGALRRQRILQECVDPSVAVLILDFILGYNASPDPVGDVLTAIVEGREARAAHDGPLTVVASVCGTEDDLQDFDQQCQRLRSAGVLVLRSNATAARFCVDLLRSE